MHVTYLLFRELSPTCKTEELIHRQFTVCAHNYALYRTMLAAFAKPTSLICKPLSICRVVVLLFVPVPTIVAPIEKRLVVPVSSSFQYVPIQISNSRPTTTRAALQFKVCRTSWSASRVLPFLEKRWSFFYNIATHPHAHFFQTSNLFSPK